MIALLLSFGGDPMTDWFEWNGKKCTEFGIHVSEHPPITLPAERSTFTNVPGRSGSLTVLEDKDVYDDMLLTCTCFIENTDRLPEIAAWLRGSGTVTFANRQGGFYHARVVNQIPFEKVLRGHPHRSFAVTFRCQPFFYLKADDITVTAPGTFIANPGCIASEPVVRVTLSGDAEITIGGYLFSLTDVTGTVTIDTPRLECYQDYTSRNACMAGDYPKIPAVGAYVSWTGDVEKIVITPNWRTL